MGCIRVEHRPRVGPQLEVAEGVILVRGVDCVMGPRLESKRVERPEHGGVDCQIKRSCRVVLLENDGGVGAVSAISNVLGLQRLRDGRTLENHHRHADARVEGGLLDHVESLETDKGGSHKRLVSPAA